MFALARAGIMSYVRAFNILSFLEFEDAYAPWLAAVTGFNFLLRRVAHNEQDLARLQVQIIKPGLSSSFYFIWFIKEYLANIVQLPSILLVLRHSVIELLKHISIRKRY